MQSLQTKQHNGLLLLTFMGLLFVCLAFSVHKHPFKKILAKAGSPNILFVIADDWSYPHAGAYGDNVVRTPNFDKLAKGGLLFTNAYCASPSCTPSRAAILTGQYPHRLEEGGNLWGTLPKKYSNYVDILETVGYTVGFERKGWGPGNFVPGGYKRNPAGTEFKTFGDFISRKPANTPFCYWFGSRDPHREYEKGTGVRAGLDASKIKVPGGMPNVAEVREDIADYYYEVERFDKDLGMLVQILQEKGDLENTLIVVTGDNGMPFPRAKANLYDWGTHVPLLMYWPNRIKQSGVVSDFVSLVDLAPTFLEAAGQVIPGTMSGNSLLNLLNKNKEANKRDKVFVERERHANVRRGDLSYPSRGIRTKDFLYIQNLRPDRWPAGDPETYMAVGPFGDVDDSPSKQFILAHKNDRASSYSSFYNLGFAKRPNDELYDLAKDPEQLKNVAGNRSYKSKLETLKQELSKWMVETGDPRIASANENWDSYPYYGPPIGPDTYKALENK